MISLRPFLGFLLFFSLGFLLVPAASVAADPATAVEARHTPEQVELGRRMYQEGILPSGELMTARVQGDIRLTGEQVICGACHRRSGMGASEGQEVVPAVTGDILYAPLRLPTLKPPLPPTQRAAYTDETLKRAIRDGIGPDGQAFNPFMPNYPLSDTELDSVIAYLRSLSIAPAPGVTETEVHFATIVADAVEPAARKAFLDTMQTFVAQKNVPTRNEDQRAAHAPWHKAWVFGPYRKWVLHVWELNGPRESWPEQLAAQYAEQPVFAVVSGLAPGGWQPMHEFCEGFEVPCLFPITDLPVIDDDDFYTVYLSRGMVLEGEAIARHLAEQQLLGQVIVQVYREGDAKGQTAAAALRDVLQKRGLQVRDARLQDGAEGTTAFWQSLIEDSGAGVVVSWLGASDMAALWSSGLPAKPPIERIYLSSTQFGPGADGIPPAAVDRVYFIHPYELPQKLNRLLLRSTGWLRSKRIYAPAEKRIQADAFFALKMAGGAMKTIRGYFIRDYFLESIEHMVDNASYTSVYPRVSLAPGQRFVVKGYYIAKDDGKGGLQAVTEWGSQ